MSVTMRCTSASSSGRSPRSSARPSSSSIPCRRASSCSRVESRPQRERVLALDAIARVEESFGPRAVVGQDEQSLGVLVEAPDRVQPRTLRDERGRDEIEHGPLGMPVARGRGHARRLVEQQVRRLRRRSDDPSVHRDHGAFRVGLVADFRHPAVDGHAALGDEVLAGAARRDARRGEHLLEALGGHQACGSGASGTRRLGPAPRLAPQEGPRRPPRPGVPRFRARAGAARRGSSVRSVRGSRSPCHTGTDGRARPTGRARRSAGGAAASGRCSRSRRHGCARSPNASPAADTRRSRASRGTPATAGPRPPPRTARSARRPRAR